MTREGLAPVGGPTLNERQRLLTMLVSREELLAGSRTTSYDEALACLRRMQQRAKERFREWARRLHPDRNSGDSAKAELLARLSAVNDEFQEMVPVQLDPVQRVVITIHCSIGGIPIP